ncbi:MAG TPA: cation diffusion facilitator family transporter [Stellaceae bacterium]|nr:cation diffusion facilitator family transporter [Stellaceae bacterium]
MAASNHDHGDHALGHGGCGHDHDDPHHGHDHGATDHAHHGRSHASHSHAGHSHAAPPADGSLSGAFALGIGLNLAFVIAEIVIGIAADSVALIADAGHNFGDVLGLVLSWGAILLAKRAPSRRRTYGMKRSSVLASLINAVVLLVGVGGIAMEALRRLVEPGSSILPVPVMAAAAAGILVNGFTAWLFHKGNKADINLRGAFLHMASDALVSAGVVIAAFLVLWTDWQWLDPVVGLIIAAIILVSTWSLLRQSLDLALDAVPSSVDPEAVRAYLASLPGVVEVHDLHIWALGTTDTALTVHLVRPDSGLDDALIATICHELRERFGIGHATFQIEQGDAHNPCALAPAHVV